MATQAQAAESDRVRSAGDRLGSRRPVGCRHRRLARPQGDRGGEGAGARRHHGLVRRLDVGAAATRWRSAPGSSRTPRRRAPICAMCSATISTRPGSTPSSRRRRAWSPSSSSTPPCSSRAATRSPTPTAMSPGAGTGGRSVIAAPYDARGLGDLVARLRRPMRETTFMGMTIQAGPDLAAFMNVTRSPRAFAHAARRFGRHLIDLAAAPAGHAAAQRPRPGGAAAALGRRSRRRSAHDLPRRCGCSRKAAPSAAPCWHARGRGGSPRPARRRARRRRLPARSRAPARPVSRRRGAPDRGRSLGHRRRPAPRRVGRRRGWTTRSPRPAPGARCRWCRFPTARRAASRTSSSATSPASSACSRDGRRFCNEGNGYHDYVAAMLRAVPPGQEVASWLVCTRAFQRRYGLGIARPTPLPVGPYIRSGYLKTGRTIAELARNCGIDPDGLERTVAEYNGTPARARTPRSAAARTPYNRYRGRRRQPAQPLRRADRARAVLRGQGGPRQLRHLRRTEDRRQRPRAGRGRRCRSRASTRPAPTWRASWAATIPPAASISARR